MNVLLPLRYVAVGGAVGALVRWAALEWVGGSPTVTVLVLNTVGSFILGLLVGGRRPRRGRPRITENQLLLGGAGFCGGLTTFATFAVDVAVALDDGDPLRALWVAAATAAATVVVAGIGYRVGSRP
ncbi:MAG: fluoride efflux transporter FluC [Acidimicrobiales bacterium]